MKEQKTRYLFLRVFMIEMKPIDAMDICSMAFLSRLNIKGVRNK